MKYLRFEDRVVYEIYVRSFLDSNNDGVGDIPGVTAKLDYLEWLGINTIWLTPFYPSPNLDYGYDVSDHWRIAEEYGSMVEFQNLTEEAHRRNISVIIDFVTNHTSNQHPWFLESRQNKRNAKRNWYIWQDPKADGSPPNNWQSQFGGSAWQRDEATGQYYLHTFLKEQPDLNWANPMLRHAMQEILRYWLKRGVDGFRFDWVYSLAKDSKFRDEPINPDYRIESNYPYDSLVHSRTVRQPRLYEYLHEMTEGLADFPHAFIVSEAYPTAKNSIDEYFRFYNNINPRRMLPFNFELLSMPWNARAYKTYLDAFQAKLGSHRTPVYVSGNHDSMRLASRVGTKNMRAAATLLLSLPGMPCLYFGDEIGMTDEIIPNSGVKDMLAKSFPDSGRGRDPERTPMLWTRAQYAGFSHKLPWLPYVRRDRLSSVEGQAANKNSLLHLYRTLLHLRHVSKTLRHGTYVPMPSPQKDIFCFKRQYQDETLVIAINFSGKRHRCPVTGEVMFTTAQSTKHSDTLNPHEARIYRINSNKNH